MHKNYRYVKLGVVAGLKLKLTLEQVCFFFNTTSSSTTIQDFSRHPLKGKVVEDRFMYEWNLRWLLVPFRFYTEVYWYQEGLVSEGQRGRCSPLTGPGNRMCLIWVR